MKSITRRKAMFLVMLLLVSVAVVVVGLKMIWQQPALPAGELGAYLTWLFAVWLLAVWRVYLG
jgi:hypothetical protein